MIRRDQFIKKLAEVNSGNYLNEKMAELEMFVDAELNKESNLTKMSNTNTQGSRASYTVENVYGNFSFETVTSVEQTYALHNSSSVVENNGTANGKKIWSDDLKYNTGAPATLTPWKDLTTDSNFDGKLKIELPEGTNKNVAQMLANKYMNTTVQANTPIGGYWGTGNVIVTWMEDTGKLFMTFKLN